uniref:Ribosomal RNA processing 1 n=1 Tax=Salarias fasciatus TaxID=181472 RepID=A0A672HWL8_SALFA
MASLEEPEVQFAQRLAGNERSTRSKALKKLRKYISVRSHNPTGGFTSVELLKLWKGLFYCLWMQDKPLMQEELSRNISTLIHNFHQFDTQLLYLESFLQTVKREWTGIDRLRMDKFFQLVRFMFRQTFELLKKNSWDSGKFVDLLTAELLQSSSEAPSGLQLHVLDLYLTELAAVGSAELTADQSLVFIVPFCKIAAKTKDAMLLGAICSSIFSTIIDQAPFAIQDLMKELKAADSDSGQASDEEEEEEEEKPAGKNKKHKEEKPMDLEHPDSELQDDIGPVLQFDYSAVADKLLELSSRSSTPASNRQRLYKIIKVLRNLSEGIFPQEEFPEEVSTDEDDDMFATRKKLKRFKRKGQIDGDLDGSPAAKKSKPPSHDPTTRKYWKWFIWQSSCDPAFSLISTDKAALSPCRVHKRTYLCLPLSSVITPTTHPE